MEKLECQSCFSNKTILRCADCESPSCKKCACFVDDTEFEYPSFLPADVNDKTFCPACFTDRAEPILIEYREILAKAKAVNIYDIKQSSETGRIRRIERPIKVKDCDDRSETQMRLAFAAAQKGFDTLVDVSIKSEKVGERTYKKLVWEGSGVPVDPNIKK